MITITSAGTADAMLIAELSRQTFYDTFAAANTAGDMELFMNDSFSTEKLVAEVNEPGYFFFIAREAFIPLGYLKLSLSANPPELGEMPAIEISRIYAVTNAIGKGIGNALMQHALDAARNMGRACIWLGVWEHNQRAIEFYRRQGFEKFGEHPFILGNDVQTDWLMKKNI